MNIEQTFNAYAKLYDKKFNQNPLGRYQRERVHQEIQPYLNSSKKILDVGCGPGSDFEFYKSLELDIEAIDISGKMVELAKQKAKSIQLQAAVKKTSLDHFCLSHKYQVIILNFGVINAIENIDVSFKKLKSLLDNGGTLIIVAMPPFHLFTILELLGKFKFKEIFKRVFQKKAVLKKGLRVFYYNKKDFKKYFRVIKKVNLCSILPNPEQYIKRGWASGLTNKLIKLDKKAGRFIPDFVGGDHIIYFLQDRNVKTQHT